MKKGMRVLFTLVLLISFMASVGYAGSNVLKEEYQKLQKELDEKIKTIKSRKEYNVLLKYRSKALNDILSKIKRSVKSDENMLLKAQIMMDLRQMTPAMTIFDKLIKNGSKLANEAKLGKVRGLLATRKSDEAYTLFKEIEADVKPSPEVDEIFMTLAFTLKDEAKKTEYANKYLKSAGNDPKAENNKAYIYDLLASIEKKKGNIDKAVQILEKGAAEVKGMRAKRSLNSSLKQMKLIGKPAAELVAKNWINSKAFKLADMKGKVVVIDFWAPWCGPCRKVIPGLVKAYEENASKGLVVLGFTKLYGRYSDDKGSKGQVAPEKEKELIAGFLKRFNIKYPIAIAEGNEGFNAYAVAGIPTMVLIDKKGIVHDITVGSGDEKALAENIAKLLK